MKTYIQTAFKGQLVKVQPADSEFCQLHLKKVAKACRHYTIVPESPTASHISR